MPYGNQVGYTGQPILNNPFQQTTAVRTPQQTNNNYLGLNEVSGIEGVNRYPVAPGATVPLKDANSDLLFVKACDMTGTPLPLRVMRLVDVTQEYQQNEGPVTRKEFNSLQESINSIQQMLEFLTAPDAKEAK